MLKKPLIIICALCILSACEKSKNTDQEHKEQAEKLFLSVYGGDPSQIDSLVSSDVVASYPIFEQLFGTRVIHGREAYKKLAIGFGERWTDVHVTIHEDIAEDERVVLVWSFRARRMITAQDSSTVVDKVYNWGGISLFRFNESGKITAEIGEESTPGPMNRLELDNISEY
jgi:hypothetical protein